VQARERDEPGHHRAGDRRPPLHRGADRYGHARGRRSEGRGVR